MVSVKKISEKDFYKTRLIEEKIKTEKQKQSIAKTREKERKEEKKERKILRTKEKERKQRAKQWKQLKRAVSKKVAVKRILKKSDVRVNMPQKRIESVLGDTNRFFKNEYEQEKRSMFL